MSPALSDFLDEHAAASLDKQLGLADIVSEFAWHFDMASGVLSFGHDLRRPVQLLGTESTADDSWRWAWANTSPDIPEPLLGSVRLLRLLGEQRDIPELIEPDITLDSANGHFFALLASGVCRSAAYYRAPYESGALFLLLQGHGFAPTVEGYEALARIVSVFPHVLTAVPVGNHRRAFIAYLEYYGIQANAEGDALVLREGLEPVLTAVFDGADRLTRLEANLRP